MKASAASRLAGTARAVEHSSSQAETRSIPSVLREDRLSAVIEAEILALPITRLVREALAIPGEAVLSSATRGNG